MALWRIRATVDDRPGYLSVLTASLALRSVNILAVQVHTTEAGAVYDFLVDAPDAMTEADLLAAIERGRGRDAFVARAAAQGLADQPTRALALAGRLVRDPDGLGDALAALLDADDVTWRPTLPEGTGFEAYRMRLHDPAGGVYDVQRTAPAFTPAEYARAQALVEVAGAIARATVDHACLLLADGAEVLIRPATAEDLPAVRALGARRYPGRPPLSDARMRRILEPAAGVTLLAWHEQTDRVVAMATLVTEGDLGEISALVADDWTGRGVGTAVLRRLTSYAQRAGIRAVTAHAAADDDALQRTLRRLGGSRSGAPDAGMISVTVPTGDRRTEAPAA
jgi:RimJ/RimL family protein N-acetyltransferase